MAAARRAIRAKQAGNQVIVVVSARGDTTDDLIALAREITEQPPAREMDMLLATGEQISIALMAMAIQALGEPAISFTGAQIGIVTDSFHTKARIKNISTQRMRQALDEGNIVIVAGFQGIDENGNITTLGRGGSDTTAVALAAVMKHDPAAPDRRRSAARSTPTWTASTRPTRARARGPQDRRDQLRRDAGAGQRRRRRDALAVHRVRQEVRRAAAGAQLVQRRRGDLDRARGRTGCGDVAGLRRGHRQGRGPRQLDGVPDRAGRQPSHLRAPSPSRTSSWT